jgi:CHAT domain-containing protein
MKTLYLLLIFLPFFALAQETQNLQNWQKTYNKADSLLQKRNFKQAMPLFEQALAAAETEFGKESENYLKTRNGMGRSMIFVGDKNKTEVFLLENVALCKKNGENSEIYAQALIVLGIYYQVKPNYTLAETHYLLAVEIYENIDKKSVYYAELCNNIGVLYREIGKDDKSLKYLKEQEQIIRELVGTNHPTYIRSLTNLAITYQKSYNFYETEKLYLKILAIQKNTVGENSLEYSYTLSNLGIIYRTNGLIDNAENLFQRSLKIKEATVGKNSLDYALTLNNLGLIYLNKDKFIDAYNAFKTSLEIKKSNNVRKKDMVYLTTFGNIAYANHCLGNYKISEKQYKECIDSVLGVAGHKNRDYLRLNAELAALYGSVGYNKTEQTYWEIIKQYESTGYNHSQKYFVYINLADFYQSSKLNQKAIQIFEEITNLIVSKLSLNFSFLSDQEKLQYNKFIKIGIDKFNSFAITQKLNADLYNLQLFNKGILLNSSQKIRKSILASTDTVLKKDFENWTNFRLTLSKNYQLSKEELAKNKINVDSLENVANEMEKSLSIRSASFAKLTDKKQLTWKDIQKKLKRKEAAIEIVRINKFGVQKIISDTTNYAYRDSIFKTKGIAEFPTYPRYGLTDTVYYAALIVKKKSKEPELVLLTNGNELENRAFKLYRNSINYKVKDGKSYQNYWKPIKEKLQGIKKVYVSPDGIYNQINFNALQNPETKQYLMEETEVQQVTNTKDILAFQSQKSSQSFQNLVKAGNKAVLFGRPAYNLSNVVVKNTDFSNEKPQNYALRSMQSLQRGNFVDLLGTEKEILIIDSLLQTQNLATEKHLLTQATEEKIKELRNPTILHIATHGFFVSDSATVNPMLNSGILLAGVSNYFQSVEKSDTEDGVLTAYEAQNLHLDQTDLVVLSACETGLGEIQAGEGVYGLQRAFKMAGAKSILMSLWKVDDKVTQELMAAFYTNWLKIGNKRQAFLEAQQQIKQKYPEPFYWAAFVLVGE